MSNDSKVFQRIRGDEATGALGWNLPQMSAPSAVGLQQKNAVEVTVVEEVIAAEKITVSELESIRESARLDGLSAGLEEGRNSGLEQGRKEGVVLGRDTGFKEGLKQGEAEIQRLQNLFGGMIAELETPLKESSEAIEQQLLDLVVMLSEAVVGTELSTRKDLLLGSIQNALQELPDPLTEVSITVNPEDKQHLEQVVLLPGVSIDIIEDEALTVGGYCIKTTNTLVQHEVESRFSDVIKQFYDSMPSQASDSHE